jgi:GNAT superfamily N-acetyltransferase
MKPATFADTDTLVDLMDEFYAEAGFKLDRTHALEAFAALLVDPRLGRIWLIQAGSIDVGYVALAFVYSLEHGGPAALLDDFFVRAPFRNTGLGTAALAAVRAFCVEAQIRAVSVEVGKDNAVAQAVYRSAGFVPADRQLMVLELADPTHLRP